MTRKQEKVYNTFIRGLITEASPLSYPPDASYDEDNCMLFQKGSRTRRLGIDYDPSSVLYTLSGITAANIDENAISGFVWNNPGNNIGLSYYVLQVGLNLFFFNLNTEPVTLLATIGGKDLTSFAIGTTAAAAASKLQFTAGQGVLFCAGSQYEPFMVQLTSPGVSVSLTRIYVQVRDLDGVNDSLDSETEPSSLTNPHKYNLYNQGWCRSDPSGATANTFDSWTGLPTTKKIIEQFITAPYHSQSGVYPGNNKVWYMAIDSKGTGINVDQLRKLQVGSGLAAKGYFILNAFNKDYSAASGISGLTALTTSNRPTTIGFFAGRVWYAVNSTVYFSQVLRRPQQAGMCYQENDPTAQDINQLLASDGGVIQIPEMSHCIKLFPVGSGLLALADNGVWYITGNSSGFSATDFTVSKLSPIGSDSPDSVIEIDGEVYWFSRVGIQGMSQKNGLFGPVQNNVDKLIITNNTIQGYYNQLSDLSRQTAQVAYDPATNVIQWMFKNPVATWTPYFDWFLNFNLNTRSFYPWSIPSSMADIVPFPAAVFITPLPIRLSGETDRYLSYFKYLFVQPDSPSFKICFGQFYDNSFSDWRTFEGETGYEYSSYLETGFEMLGTPSADGSKMVPALMRKKRIPFLMSYLQSTETAWVSVSTGQYVVDKPSSCILTTKWDWSRSAVSNKWSSPVELYRRSHIQIPDNTSTSLDTGYPTVVSKNKIRGNGRAIQFKFETHEIAHDFNLLGWAVIYAENMFA